MFMVEGDSACYECLFPKRTTCQWKGAVMCESGVLATTPVMIASLQAHHHLLYLGLNRTPLKQKTVTLGWVKYDATHCSF